MTRGAGDWDAVLDVLGEAPLLAAAAAIRGSSPRSAHGRRGGPCEAIAAGHADPVATAERWARSELALRLRCFENWLTERIPPRRGRGGLFDRNAGCAHFHARERS